jgi:hypothetical protein
MVYHVLVSWDEFHGDGQFPACVTVDGVASYQEAAYERIKAIEASARLAFTPVLVISDPTINLFAQGFAFSVVPSDTDPNGFALEPFDLGGTKPQRMVTWPPK